VLYHDVEQSYSLTISRLLSIAHDHNIPLSQISQACEAGIGPSPIAKVPVHLEFSQLEFGRIGIGISHDEAQRTLHRFFITLFLLQMLT
jgi:hypothetical protein